MDPLMIAGLLLAGILIATVAMAIGIGGGILWTPILILAYGLSPAEAVATSLGIQVLGLGSGAFAYLRAGLVVKKLTGLLFLAALPGVIIGSLFTINVAQNQVQLALGIMAMTLALLFVFTYEGNEVSKGAASGIHFAHVKRILPVPAFFGTLMGFLSVGIGEWVIPLLKSRLGLNMNQAVGTVVVMMFLLALSATGIHGLYSHNIQWQHLLWGAVGTVVGAQIGVAFAKRMKERLLKEAFIYLMTLTGIHLIFQAV